MKSKTLPIVGILFALFFIGLGLNSKSKNAELAAKGVSMPGTITSAVVKTGSKNKKKYHLTVTWKDDAKLHVGEDFEVKAGFYKSHVDGTEILDPNVSLRHIPGVADSAIIEGGSSDFAGMEYLGYLVGAISIVMGFFAFRPRRQLLEYTPLK